LLEARLERTPDQPRVSRLGVAQLPGLVQRLRRNQLGAAHLFRCGKAALTVGPDLASRLRRVVFVREPALGSCLDFEGVGLSAVSGRDQLRGIWFSQSGRLCPQLS